MDYQQRLAQTLRDYGRAGFQDPWDYAYARRFNPQTPGFLGKHDESSKNVEHYLYARDQASLGPYHAAQMAIGTPGHALLKALGIKGGEPSLAEVYRGWQGTAHGLGDWARANPRQTAGTPMRNLWEQMPKR